MNLTRGTRPRFQVRNGRVQVVRTADFLILVMEFASAGSIAQYRWPPDFEERRALALYFFQQLISAVEHMHTHGVYQQRITHKNSLLHWEHLPNGDTFLAVKVDALGLGNATTPARLKPGAALESIAHMSPVRRHFLLGMNGHLNACRPATVAPVMFGKPLPNNVLAFDHVLLQQ